MNESSYQTTVESLLKKSVFLVEATRTEAFFLWQQYAKNSPYCKHFHNSPGLTWENDMGWMVTVGRLDKRPINIDISFTKIGGKYICFWHGTSQLVDYKLIEKWFEKRFTARWDNNSRIAKGDAMNFHNCIAAIREKSK